MQRRFVSDVSHELRTPLTTVRMAGDVLHDARARLRPGHRAGRRAAPDRARPVRDAARRPARDQPLRRRRRGARARRRQPRRRRAPDRRRDPRRWPTSGDVQVVVEAPDQPCLAEADVRRVERIVRNLVTNAIDHAETGDIVVRVAGDDHAAAIAVRDYGVGLGARGRPRWSSTGSGGPTRPAPAPAAAPASACRSRSRTPTCTAAGCRPGAGPGEGAQFRLTLPRRAGGVLRHSPLPLVPADADGAGAR